jgi:hypothetical protein
MTPIEMQTDTIGNAALCPITACEVRIASNEMVILVIQYVESIKDFDTGNWKQLQAVLSAGRAMQLSESLEKAASLFLSANAGKIMQ